MAALFLSQACLVGGIDARFCPGDLVGESYSAGTDFSLALLLSIDRNLSSSAIM
jgi:hypothetical protein